MLRRLLASLVKTVTLVPALDRFHFSARARAVAIDTAVRVGPQGRIVDFGFAERPDGTQVLPLFTAGEGTVDERVLVAICRRGLALALGTSLALRPRVVVRGLDGVRGSREVFARVLRDAGASTVEFED